MRSLKTLILLALVTAGVLIAAVLYRPPTDTVNPADRGPLLPGLAGRLNGVQTVVIQHGGETLTLQRKDGAWTVAEKAGYPAQVGQVRELLLGLAHLQRIEPKTRNPEHYAALGLTNPDKSGGEASRIELKDAAGQPIARVTLGKRRPSAAEPDRSDLYILLPDDPQSWRVAGRIPALGAAGAWLKRTLLELERTRIAGVTLAHADGETLHLIPKEAGKGEGFTLEGLGAGESLKNDYALDDIADRFTRLQLEDVRPADQLQWPARPDLQATARTRDGLEVRLTAAKIDGKSWIRLVAEALPSAPSAAAAVAQGSAATTGQAKTPAEPSKGADKEPKKTPQQEAATLNARWQGWAYTLADWAYQALDKHRADLVKAPEAQPAAPQTGDKRTGHAAAPELPMPTDQVAPLPTAQPESPQGTAVPPSTTAPSVPDNAPSPAAPPVAPSEVGGT